MVTSFGTLESNTMTSFGTLEKKMLEGFAELREGRWKDKVWWLLISASLLGIMAHGFKWI